MDYVEVDRGSYGAEFGDRTYGVFNVVPRTGFERNNQAELSVSAGNFYQTNDALSFGSHTERFAYYASINGNRSNLGLQPPVPQVVHDAVNGYGGFGSFIYNVDPSNQLRLVTSARHDYFQIPYDPFPNDFENEPGRQLTRIPASAFAMASARPMPECCLAGCTHSTRICWRRSRPSTTTTAADYASNPNDYPVATHRKPQFHLCRRPGQLRRQLQEE